MAKATQHIVAAALLAGVAPLVAAGAASPLPPASFLHSPVSSVAELAQEVSSDPAVQERLAHHFHISGPALCAYVHDDFVLTTLASASKFQIFCLNPQTGEYQVSRVLPAGTPVFAALGTGRPILIAASGDPLTDRLAPARSGGAGGGMTALAAAAGLGSLALFAHSGGGGASASAAPFAPAALARPAVAEAQEMPGAAAGQVVFTQPHVPSALPKHEESLAPDLLPAPMPQVLLSQVSSVTTPYASVPTVFPLSSPTAARAGTPTIVSWLPTAIPKAMAVPMRLAVVPEPSPGLTFAVAVVLLTGLAARRRARAT